MSTLGRSGHSGSSPDLGSLLSGRGAPPGSLPGGSLLWCHPPSCSRGAERRGRHGVHGQLSAGRDRQVPLAESPPTRVSGLKPTSMSMPGQLGPSWGDTPHPTVCRGQGSRGGPECGASLASVAFVSSLLAPTSSSDGGSVGSPRARGCRASLAGNTVLRGARSPRLQSRCSRDALGRVPEDFVTEGWGGPGHAGPCSGCLWSTASVAGWAEASPSP